MKKKLLIGSLCVICILCSTMLLACKSEEKIDGGLEVSYDIKCALDDESCVLYVTSEVEILNKSKVAIKELPFYLYPNAYLEEGGAVTISNVATRERDLIYNIDNINMKVELNEDLKEGENVAIIISSRVEIPKGKGRLGYGDGYYNLHAFYPRLACFHNGSFDVVPYSKIGDSYCFDMANFKIKINYPSAYTLASAGEQTHYKENEKYKESVYCIDNARDVALSLSKKFTIFESEIEGVKISQYTMGKQDYTPFIANCLGYFIEEVGEYPYENFTIVETPFEYGGMEYSGLALINESVSEKEFVIAHEIIHQWFGLSVGSNSYKECWVDESLTNYLTYYYMDIYNRGGYEENMELERKRYKKFLEASKEKYGIGYMPRLDYNLEEFKSESEYANMVYGYGVLTYDGVRKVIGDKKFKKAVRDYYENYKGKIASKEDLIASFNKSAGKKVEGIFNGYIESKVVF